MSARSNSAVRDAFDGFIRWTIEIERPDGASFLPAADRAAFLDYYRRLPAAGDERAIRRYLRGFWHGEAGWAARWLAARERPRVVDAGSGFGTYSMLFAAMGADVTGADLRPDRLDAAERRLRFYRDSGGEDLQVRYARADLTREWPGVVDLVWVYNALSHIDPLDDFLRRVRVNLAPGGVLVIGDINGAHPTHLRRLAKLRTDVHQEYVAPDGVRHAYAVERTFTPRDMRDVMEANGLSVIHHELYWGGLGILPEALYEGVVRPLQRPGGPLTALARRQLVVAAAAPAR
jgi:SAM-dependent methyltransferase